MPRYASKATSSVVHQSLDHNSDQIRILTLKKGSWSDEISCSLRAVSLEQEKGRYHALSYRWGDENDREQILVDGKLLNVTTSLYIALKHLRLDSTDRDLWIDQICINQGNPNEKQHQISLMKPIYVGSAQVIIWLGESDKHSDRLADMISTANLFKLTTPAEPGTEESIGQELRIMYNLILHICRREWWSRVWVVQECVLPVEPPVFMCGKSSFIFTQLENAFEALMLRPKYTTYLDSSSSGDDADLRDELGAAAKTATDLLQPLDNMITLRYTLASTAQRTISLVDCLQLTVCRSTTIPHDHVYGFLGLVSLEESKELLNLGTNIPAPELFHKFMILALGSSVRDDAIGCYQALRAISFKDTNDPSWVPDLSAHSFSDRRNSVYLIPMEPAKTRFEPNIWFESDGLMMKMLGFHLDTITYTQSLSSDRQPLPAAIKNCQENTVKPSRSLLSIFCRILTCKGPPNTPASVNFRRLFTCNFRSGFLIDQPKTLDKLWELWILSETGHSRSSQKEFERAERKLGTDTVQSIFDEFRERSSAACEGRFLFRTTEDYWGISGVCLVGDVVMLPCGFVMPLILHPSFGYCKIAGGAYIDGLMMDGAIDSLVDERGLVEKTWKIY